MTPAALKFWRAHLRLSQKAAAEAIGLSFSQYKYYEAGRDPVPRKVELACAALALGITRYQGPPG